MLELHRASAGSGKTYTLARKYIWYLITIKPENGPCRLRTDAELADSSRHILAVTFTNKATNEMQLRILDRLFDIAYRKPHWAKKEDGTSFIKSPDYLGYFTDELKETPARIADSCRKALRLLLENYSDFKVSTIDSFFQLVLRTLAYEVELNDSYQVELESAYLSQMAVDGVLEEIDSDGDNADTTYWIKMLMDRSSGTLKMFSKDCDSPSYVENPYKTLVESVTRLENEDYKLIRENVEAYFKRKPDFKALYDSLSEKYETKAIEAFRQVKKICRQIAPNLPMDDPDYTNARTNIGRLTKQIVTISKMKDSEWAYKDFEKPEKMFTLDYIAKGPTAKAIDRHAGLRDVLEKKLHECSTPLSDWCSELRSPEVKLWKIYSENLPYMALFDILGCKRQEYLDETNSVELGETAMILRGVIGQEDTPFIYERLGSTLNHFLIDEFQDTSRLQWENMEPLLSESMSRNHDNLIIGDAKQSIYRFRNADPSLITTVVPRDFANRVTLLGERSEENTNYRSQLHVVQFNNSFFEYLAKRIDASIPEGQKDQRMKFVPLYSNVVQTPSRRDDEGYVEVCIGSQKDGFDEYRLKRLPELVEDMINRGHKQRDIAVLVSRATEGEQVIAEFVRHNRERDEDGHEIRFVSEQSLKVANSSAVITIVGVLENIARGFKPKLNEEEARLKWGVGNWNELQTSFRFFAIGQDDTPMAELLDRYIEETPDYTAITKLLDSLPALTIPAIVEGVVAHFIPEETRRKEAIFISAFQDQVLEYCDTHSTDIGSFLKWWNRRKSKASITSPEGTDAVNVLTIHKSKGLEYDCVIIPFADYEFADKVPTKKEEWRWVTPQILSSDAEEMPPFIPVATTMDLEGTPHAPLLYDYFDHLKMDALNLAYVAFTRAGMELYIFSKADVKKDDKKSTSLPVGKFLDDYLQGKAGEPEESDAKRLHGRDIARLEGGAPVVSEDDEEGGEGNTAAVHYSSRTTIGRIIPDVEAWREMRKRKKLEEEKGEQQVVDDVVEIKSMMLPLDKYESVIPDPSVLKFRAMDLPEVDEEEDGDDAELDPRSEGNVKHAILELVDVPADLTEAVKHVSMLGLLPHELQEKYRENLAAKLSQPTVSRWFDGKARSINERPLLQQGEVSRRPDRLLLYDDGHVEVVDYKFGKKDETGRHRRQVSGYVRLLAATGQFTRVEGYLWYVNEDSIELVAKS